MNPINYFIGLESQAGSECSGQRQALFPFRRAHALSPRCPFLDSYLEALNSVRQRFEKSAHSDSHKHWLFAPLFRIQKRQARWILLQLNLKGDLLTSLAKSLANSQKHCRASRLELNPQGHLAGERARDILRRLDTDKNGLSSLSNSASIDFIDSRFETAFQKTEFSTATRDSTQNSETS